MDKERLGLLEESIRNIYLSLYYSLSEISETDEETLLAPEEIEETDSLEILTHIGDSLTDLISLKHTLRTIKDYSTLSGNKSYQEQLQSLESEIRNHVKTQLQMKVHIDSLQDKLEKHEKKLDKFKTLAEEKIKTLKNEKKEIKESPLRLKKEFEKILTVSRQTENLQMQISKHKHELTNQVLEIKELKRQEAEFFNLLSKSQKHNLHSESLVYWKRYYETTNIECSELQKRINNCLRKKFRVSKSKSPLIRSTNRIVRRSASPLLRPSFKNPYKLPQI